MAGSRIGPCLSAGALFGILVAVPVCELMRGRWPGKNSELTLSAWADGSFGREVEKELEDHSVAAAFVRPLYHAAVWDLFRATPASVAVGADDWLFLASTVYHYPDPAIEAMLPETAGLFAWVQEWLAQRGTKLVVLVVPNKASMYPHRLAKCKPAVRSGYESVRRALDGAGVVNFPLDDLLRPREHDTYYRTDTHWRAEAQNEVAAVLARTVRPWLDEQAQPAVEGEVRPVETEAGAEFGDLALMLGLPEEALRRRGLSESTISLTGFEKHSGRPLGNAPASDIVLVGTSFSAAGFGGLLAVHLGVDVEWRGGPGQVPADTLVEFLIALRSGLRPAPRVVILELPERYFFLSAAQLQEPLRRFQGSSRYTKRALEFRPAKVETERVELIDQGSGVLEGTPQAKDAELVYTLAEPVAGDGSLVLRLCITPKKYSAARVWFDSGAGFAEDHDAQELLPRPGQEHEIFVPARTRDGQPVVRIRIHPALGTARFRLAGLEWRSRDP